MIKGRLNFLNKDIHYYVGNVYEYDIKHAYPSILKGTDFKFNDKKLREDLENFSNYSNKKNLLIRIGKEIGTNKDISKYLNLKLINYIENIQELNNLNDDNVISIKKDAIFVNKKCNVFNFENIEFSLKNKYNMYFYDYISRHEYYISKNLNKYSYSIKGKGATDIEKDSYDVIVKCIFNSLSNGNLESVKHIQETFFSRDLSKLEKYLPSFIPFCDSVYMPKHKLFEDGRTEDIDVMDIYFSIFSPPLKCLINYLL